MNKDNDLESRIQLAAQVLKSTLEQTNLYIAIDIQTKEFMFLDRDAHSKGIAKYGRVKIEDINISK